MAVLYLLLLALPTSVPPCGTIERVAACLGSPGSPGALPSSPTVEPAHLLTHVDRQFGLPPEFPVPPELESVPRRRRRRLPRWHPCRRRPSKRQAELLAVRLTCVPPPYRANLAILRPEAWDAPSPNDRTLTHDGQTVGFGGRVGFKALLDAARAEAGWRFFIASGFRSYATQQATFRQYVAEVRRAQPNLSPRLSAALASTASAHPGHSEHQLGTAADLVYVDAWGNLQGFGRATVNVYAASQAFVWLVINAHRFGIVLSYPADQVHETRYAFEPWHWRFVGVAAANAMHRCGLAPSVYFRMQYGMQTASNEFGLENLLLEERAEVAGVECRGDGLLRARFVNRGTRRWKGARLIPVAGTDPGVEGVSLGCTAGGDYFDVSVPTANLLGDEPTLWQLVADDGHWLAGGALRAVCD